MDETRPCLSPKTGPADPSREASLARLAREKPLLIYDGDCGFCRRWVARWQRRTGECVAYAPYQTVAESTPTLPVELLQKSVYLVEPDGRVTHGAEAVLRTRLYGGIGRGYGMRRGWWWAYQRIPGVAALLEWGYRRIATHRKIFSTLSR